MKPEHAQTTEELKPKNFNEWAKENLVGVAYDRAVARKVWNAAINEAVEAIHQPDGSLFCARHLKTRFAEKIKKLACNGL